MVPDDEEDRAEGEEDDNEGGDREDDDGVRLEEFMFYVGDLGGGEYHFPVPGPEPEKFFAVNAEIEGELPSGETVSWEIRDIVADEASPGEYERVRVVASGDDGEETFEIALGEDFLRDESMSEGFFEYFEYNYPTDPSLSEVEKIVGIPVTDKPRDRPKEVLGRYREKVAGASELLCDVFRFPDDHTATLFVSSWLSDGAKVILKGPPGTGKTTLIEASTLLFLSDRNRYMDARWYFGNNDLTPADLDEPCPCGSGKRFRDCCFRRGFAFYQVGQKAVKTFGAKEYLNMYKKHWARCPHCSKPMTTDNVIGTRINERGKLLHYFRCDNPDCLGRREKFTEEEVEELRDMGGIARSVRPAEDHYDEWNYDIDKRAFVTEEDAEKFMEHYKGGLDTDYLYVEEKASGWVVKLLTHSKGPYFSVENFEPLLGVAKITPKKRPEEIFYYTEIEKEVVSVKGEGEIEKRERFVMPPKSRPIVKANTKFFNEFNRAMPEVQDEVLGLLEEGEVEYKGESFYSNTPFIAFFDLNPHKEQKQTILDWAFYDRLDIELILPTMDFGSKVHTLTTRFNIRQQVFEELMTDICNDCGGMVPKGAGKCPDPACGSDDVTRGVEPLFIDELDDVRRIAYETIGVTDRAYFALAVVSDLYGHSYYRYTSDAPETELRKDDLNLGDELVNPFVDISRVQWWSKVRQAEGRGIDDKTSQEKATEFGPGKERLFMMTKGGGIERPLGFRVCRSVLKMAKARAWFLTMTETIKVGERAHHPDYRKRLPDMVMEEMSDSELRKLRMAKRRELVRRDVDPKTIRSAVSKIKRETYYRLLECPNCGTSVPGSVPRGEEYVCNKCKYPFYPVFRIFVRPEDIIAVFPYCSSMRFCADYGGNFIPNEVVERYPNVTDWLRSEVPMVWSDGDFRRMFDDGIEAWNEAVSVCRRVDISARERRKKALDEIRASDFSKKAKEVYPYYYEMAEYIAQACDDRLFSDRWPTMEEVKHVDSSGKVESEWGVGRDRVSRSREAWDGPPEE